MQYLIIRKINTWLTNYLHQAGDDGEILVQKKIWWLFNFAGLFILLLAILIAYDPQYGSEKDMVDTIFFLALPLNLFLFHFYRKGIEGWALYLQISLVLICSVKVYLMGGLLFAGAPIFIGLIAPIYALILPKKKRAFFVFLLYMTLMIGATVIQPQKSENLSEPLYIYGFTLGITQIFLVLLYFTTQVDKLKRKEKKRMQELDEFKTKFYNNITHEFRTPLTIILGMADEVKNKPSEWFNEGLVMIKRNGQKLLNLTNQMLDLAKLESNAMPVSLIQDDIAVYLKYLVESFHSLAYSKKIQLVFSVCPEKILMDFDPDKIQNILSNLLSNSIKFTPKGGVIKVSASEEFTDAEKYLIFSVEDTGSGIPEEHLEKIFDRYFQAEYHKDQLIEGTGLGLALIKELVKLLEGEITAKSELGIGSTFIVRLPITNQAQEEHVLLSKEKELSDLFSENRSLSPPILNEESQTVVKQTEEKLVLLIVEDNEDVVRYLRSLLSANYNIEEAVNGQEGFEKAISIIPDLVISDVMMPVMDGFSFCEKLKSDLRTSHIPVIMLTARADTESKLEGLKTGADAYLAKPFKREELFVRIKKLIELRIALQERYKKNAILSGVEVSVENALFQKEDAFLLKVRQILEANLSDEKFGIEELGRTLGMSRSQLYRKFKALTDTTVYHFIRERRLVKARELLLTTDLNITEIAMETGFKNLSYFSRLFSEEFGKAPSKVRSRNKGL